MLQAKIQQSGVFLATRHHTPEIRQSKIKSRSVAGPMGQMNRRPSV